MGDQIDNWKYRIPLTINHKMVSGDEDLIDFPAYLVCEKPELTKAQPSGADFLFTADDGITKLSHEIRSWNPDTGHLVAYVKIPALSPKHDTVIYLYYENPTAVDQQDIEAVWSRYQMVRHVGTGRPPTTPVGGTIKPVDFITLQRKVLEDLFALDWFSIATPKRNKHPAYKRWAFCKKLEAAQGQISAAFQSAEANTEAIELARILADNASIIRCTKGPISDFSIGSLANYGDEAVQNRLRSVLPEYDQYADVLAELAYAAWHIEQGHKITVHERTGWPDFKIEIPDVDLPVFADSKHLKSGASLESFKRVIKKANKQIKVPGIECYGVVVINITDLLPKVVPLSDNPPSLVSQLEVDIRTLVREFYSSITAVILVWDELTILTGDGTGRGIGVYVRTRSHVVPHQQPLKPLSEGSFGKLRLQSPGQLFCS